MKEKMNNNDADSMIAQCKNWRKKCELLFGKEKCDKNNFHAILHAIEDIKIFGPPIRVFFAAKSGAAPSSCDQKTRLASSC